MVYCAQMGWPDPSTSLPEDFELFFELRISTHGW
jgi:hypothetical protein